jgi:hypothetical protein
MDTFLDTYDHPKLNKEDTKDINRYITCNATDVAIKSLPQKEKSRT